MELQTKRCFRGPKNTTFCIYHHRLAEFDLFLKTRKGILRICLPVMIIINALEKDVISAYDIIELYKNKYNVFLSPGTVYPIFSAVEELGYLKRIPNKKKKYYVLTKKGKNSLAQFHLEVEKIQKIISDISNF